MKILSKIFDSKSLNTQLISIQAEANNYTSAGSDTAKDSSGEYDYQFVTTDANGRNGVIDSENTGTSTKDQVLKF